MFEINCVLINDMVAYIENPRVSTGKLYWAHLLVQQDVCVCACSVTRLRPPLCNFMDCSFPGFSVHGDYPSKNTRVGCHFPLHGIFPARDQTRISCIFCTSRQILYHWVTCTFLNLWLVFVQELTSLRGPDLCTLILCLSTRWCSGKESSCQCRRGRQKFDSLVGKIP